jgi:membrane protease YdiL (CAAX protease family)
MERRLGVAFAAAPVCWVVLWWMFNPTPDMQWLRQQPGRFLMLAVLYPVVEELVFRGVVQPSLLGLSWARKSLYGLTLANLLTSVLFSGLHLFAHTPVWAAMVLVPSLVFGYFRDRYDGLRVPIVLHIWFNTGYYLLFHG